MMRVEVIRDDRDQVSGFLVDLGHTMVERRPFNAALGSRLAEELQEHFRLRNAEPNKRGWPKTGFWGQMAQSTQLTEVTEDGATVTVADERLAIHVYGGTVRPREKKALTIPIHPMARGKFVRVLEEEANIEIFRPKKEGGQPSNILAAVIGGELVPLYALVSGATIPQDPRALPSEPDLIAALVEAGGDYLETAALRRAGQKKGGQG